MKKTIIIFLFFATFFASKNILAQTYTSLVVDSANYVVVMDDYATFHLDDYWGYQILGDTVYNSKTYKKVFQLSFLHQGYVFSVPNPLILTGKVLKALLREENKVIYAINLNLSWYSNGCSNDSSEYVLYDFNKNIGDTINSCITNYTLAPPLIISDTSTVLYSSNQYKSYIFDTFNDALIEGVGSNTGLLELIGCAYKSVCVYLWNYSRGSLSSCSIVSNDKIVYQDKIIDIFPTPATNELHVKINSAFTNPISLTIYNLQGKAVEQILTKQNETVIDVSGLQQGVYGVKVIGDNINVFEKVVKL